MKRDEQRAARIKTIKEMQGRGASQKEMAIELGMDTGNLSAFLLKYRLRTGTKGKNGREGLRNGLQPVDLEEADASSLTIDELENARRVGITPGRWAWLKKCPAGGNATGWRGGAAIG